MESNEYWQFLATLAPRWSTVLRIQVHYIIYIYIRYITDLTVSICLWTSEVHTTGTDTKQPLQSYAALTLSASMTFRDYATLGRSRWLQMAPACFGDRVCYLAKWLAYQAKQKLFQKQHETAQNIDEQLNVAESTLDDDWMNFGWQFWHSANFCPGKGLGECVAWAKAKSCAAWWHATPNGSSWL